MCALVQHLGEFALETTFFFLNYALDSAKKENMPKLVSSLVMQRDFLLIGQGGGKKQISFIFCKRFNRN